MLTLGQLGTTLVSDTGGRTGGRSARRPTTQGRGSVAQEVAA